MKHLKYYLLVAVVALSIVGCRKTIEVSFENVPQELEAQGGTIELALKSNGEWVIGSTVDWIAIEPMSGNGDATLTLTALANTTGELRSAQITATTKDNTAVMNVTQKAEENYYLIVTPEEIVCGEEGGEFTVVVSSNVEWNVFAPDWISCSVAGGSNDSTIILTVSPMGDGLEESRMGDVFFGRSLVSTGANSVTDKIHVVQTADPILGIELTPNDLHFECMGETKTVFVSTEDSWTATAEDDWVTLSQAQGQGDAEISVSVNENPVFVDRRSIVHFTTAGGVQTALIIRQSAAIDPHFLEVSPLAFEFGKEGGEQEITIGCDTDWLFFIDCDWLSLSQLSGTGNTRVVLTAEQNELNEPRSTEFAIKSDGLFYELTVNQAAGDAPLVTYFDPDSLFVMYSGGIQHVQLNSNVSWQLQTSDWISMISPASGEGNASFDIIVNSHSDPEDRIGYVRAIHDGQVKATLVVVQEGKPDILETDVTSIDVRPEGGDFVVHVTANQSWTTKVNTEWMQCVPVGGFNNGSFTIRVESMPSTEPRTGQIKVVGSMGSVVVITVNQH